MNSEPKGMLDGPQQMFPQQGGCGVHQSHRVLQLITKAISPVRRQPDNCGSFLGELHTFLKELYSAAARADANAEGFAKALADLCAARGIARWEDFVGEDQRQFFKDDRDLLAQRIIAFWSELDEPMAL